MLVMRTFASCNASISQVAKIPQTHKPVSSETLLIYRTPLTCAACGILNEMLLAFSISLISGLQLVSALEAQEPLRGNSAGPLNAKFRSLVNESLQSWHVPGLSIAVIDGDDVWAEVSKARVSCHQ